MATDSEIVKNIEEALKIVDASDLPSAPTSDSSSPILPRRHDSVSSKPMAADKYGIPITNQSVNIPQHNAKPETSSLISVVPKGIAGLVRKVRLFNFSPPAEVLKTRDTEKELDIGSPDFKMKFDFESAYRDVPENKPLRLRREKRTGLVGGLLFAIFIICVSIILASIAWMATTDILGFASEDELVNVYVPAGFTLEGITDMLYEATYQE